MTLPSKNPTPFLVVVSSVRDGMKLPSRNEYYSSIEAARVAAQNQTRFLARNSRDVARVYLLK